MRYIGYQRRFRSNRFGFPLNPAVVGLSPAYLFASGQQGAWFDPSDLATLFQDSAGTTPVTSSGDPVGRMNDKSGRGNNSTQATAIARPVYQAAPSRLTLDRVDDRLVLTVPVGGWVGSMVLATNQGIATYGVTIPAGAYEIGGKAVGLYFPGNALIGQVIRNGALTAAEVADLENFLINAGAVASYGAVTDFSSFWRNRTEITSFPPIDTSKGTTFANTWRGCTSLISFPLIDMSKGTNFTNTWRGCTSLISFPTNMFDNCLATNFLAAFQNCALNQVSVDNILVSINAAGLSNGTLDINGGTSAAPSAVGIVAKNALIARGWTVTTN